MSEQLPIVYVVSDSVGETAEFVVRAAASQFDGGKVEVRRISYVDDPEPIREVIQAAKEANGFIAFTLVQPHLREFIIQEAGNRNVYLVDIMGPMLEAFQNVLQMEPKRRPGLLHQLDDQYFRRVEAIEFAVKYDDGKDPRGLLRADLVLLGVSRTSKTPLSMYLAHKRLKCANVPLVPEVEPPEELFQISPKKIIGLTISPTELNLIRQERLKSLGLKAQANYANLDRILQELEYAEKLMRRIGCPVINVSNKAVEETASIVLDILKRGGTRQS
ncbi:pyruvate, water dikinase regulatory protein [Effusibacillus dendaii]|uniref:Putative pyruvate, phosphate dikinase regulatory protein n=1 Tax=Effusibacillus dendaii TaxID=2743772 RepID=A0A7I8DB68_9BACL|nr:pyruvate, water dikinase regulatory protein [Effusibacillus dendaii]BCJ86209.1 putative pyruvate, phosphate dikinase regulatory protein [Effusibacillus dendaii]